MKKMKRISAKILLSLTIILTMMPFSLINVKASIFTEATLTVSTSRTFWEEDPEDSRYMLGTQYIAIQSSLPSQAIMYITMVTDDTRGYEQTVSPSMYSMSGIECAYINAVYPGSGDIWNYGVKFRLVWVNLSEGVIVFNYKILKTYYDNHKDFQYNFLKFDHDDPGITPSAEGIVPATLEQLVVNENVSDTIIEDYLQQINENYLPSILTYLEQIHGQLQTNGEGAYESYIYVNNASRLNIKNTTSGNAFYPNFSRTSYFGDGFTINNNGKIVCNYDGYVIIANNAYFFRYASGAPTVDIYWAWEKNNTSITGYEYTFVQNLRGGASIGSTDIVQVEEGDILDYKIMCISAGDLYYMENSSALIYYMSKDNSMDYTSVLTDQLRTQTLIYNTLQEIKSMMPTPEQDDEINLNYQEITNIDNTVNNITNNYNDRIEIEKTNIPLTELPDHESTELVNTTSLYNTIFTDLINIPDMKGIIALLILCIVILAILG